MLDLPHDWTKAPIGELIVRTSNKDPRKSGNDTFRYIDVSGVSNTSFRVESAVEMPSEEAPSRARKEVAAGDVLFATVRPTLKRVAMVPCELDGAIASTGYCVLRARPDRVDARFLYYSVMTDSFIHRMRELQQGASYPAVRDRDVHGEEIALPPLPEQRKIATVLSLVLRAIEQQERLIALTTELKKALMQKLFTEGLHGEPQKETEIGPVPESWEVVPLGNVARLGTGTTPSTKRPDYYEGDIPFIKTADITNNRISGATTHISSAAKKDYNLTLYPSGSLLMAMYGQGKTRGQVGLLTISATTTQNAAAIQPLCDMDSEFLWHFLMYRYEELRSSGALGHISHLNLGYLRAFIVVKPPIAEQREAAQTLSAIEDLIDKHNEKQSLLESLFRTLLHELMTAQIRVDDLDVSGFIPLKETASAG